MLEAFLSEKQYIRNAYRYFKHHYYKHPSIRTTAKKYFYEDRENILDKYKGMWILYDGTVLDVKENYSDLQVGDPSQIKLLVGNEFPNKITGI